SHSQLRGGAVGPLSGPLVQLVFGSGRPSTRLETTLRLISDEPPSIELALARSHDRTLASSSFSKPSPSQPSPCWPIASMISSVRSWAILAPAYFMIELAADGPWFDFASSPARRT